MPKHRIEQLRKLRGWSQEHLGGLIGRSKSVISRLEDGSARLDLDTAQKIANALEVSLAEVLGIESANGKGAFEDDVTPYVAGGDDPLASFSGPNTYLYTVSSDAVDRAGIARGDVVIINDKASRCKAVKPLEVVLVLYHRTPDGPATSLLRQFVPPKLLITNSSRGNAESVDMGDDDATIVGVVEQVHRRMSRPT